MRPVVAVTGFLGLSLRSAIIIHVTGRTCAAGGPAVITWARTIVWPTVVTCRAVVITIVGTPMIVVGTIVAVIGFSVIVTWTVVVVRTLWGTWSFVVIVVTHSASRTKVYAPIRTTIVVSPATPHAAVVRNINFRPVKIIVTATVAVKDGEIPAGPYPTYGTEEIVERGV